VVVSMVQLQEIRFFNLPNLRVVVHILLQCLMLDLIRKEGKYKSKPRPGFPNRVYPGKRSRYSWRGCCYRRTDAVMNSNRTGAATYVEVEQIQTLPTIKRSIRDLTRLDHEAMAITASVERTGSIIIFLLTVLILITHSVWMIRLQRSNECRTCSL